jgi:hypothetical protein
MHETAMHEDLDNFEDACDEDTPLKFCPLMVLWFVGKLRWSHGKRVSPRSKFLQFQEVSSSHLELYSKTYISSLFRFCTFHVIQSPDRSFQVPNRIVSAMFDPRFALCLL